MGYNGSNRKGLPQRGSGFKKSSFRFGSSLLSKSIMSAIGLIGLPLCDLYSNSEPNKRKVTKYYMNLGRKRQVDYEKMHDTLDLDKDVIKDKCADDLIKGVESYFKSGKLKNYEYILSYLISKGLYAAMCYKKLLKMYLKIGDYNNSLSCWKMYVSELVKDIVLKSNRTNIDYSNVSKIMIEDMMEDKFDDIDKYLPYEVCTVELVRAIYKYRDVESLVKRNVVVKFSSDGFPDVK